MDTFQTIFSPVTQKLFSHCLLHIPWNHKKNYSIISGFLFRKCLPFRRSLRIWHKYYFVVILFISREFITETLFSHFQFVTFENA